MITKLATDPSLILHPIRVRIVYAVEGRAMSSQQIALELPDVPQASLYRHIKKLHDAGVLVVTGERQVHGTVERVYEVEPSAAFVDDKKLVSSRDKSIRYFEIYLSCLRHAFARYTAQPVFALKKDGVTFFSEFAYLTDEEQIAFNRQVRDLIEGVKRKAPAPGRRRRNLSLIALPEAAPLPAPTVSTPHNKGRKP
jgi:predicted MarR family transcription regulator